MFFLYISKSSDRVWQKGHNYKINCLGGKGDLLTLINFYLFERHQRVFLNGQESQRLTVKAGLRQGSIMCPLLFYIHILTIYQII